MTPLTSSFAKATRAPTPSPPPRDTGAAVRAAHASPHATRAQRHPSSHADAHKPCAPRASQQVTTVGILVPISFALCAFLYFRWREQRKATSTGLPREVDVVVAQEDDVE